MEGNCDNICKKCMQILGNCMDQSSPIVKKVMYYKKISWFNDNLRDTREKLHLLIDLILLQTYKFKLKLTVKNIAMK